MKKYLAMLLTLVMMFSLVSCGDTPSDSSELSGNVSESDTEEPTTEEMTEPTTSEPLTEEPTEKKVVLDSNWECDYLKISTCSEWEEKSKIDKGTFNAFWDWGNVDEGPYYFISLELAKTSLGKMSESDLQEFYEGYFEYRAENNEDDEDKWNVLKSFTKNRQAYIILATEKDLIRTIHFSTDNVEGHFVYTTENEDIIIDMIDSIEFY